MVISLFIDNVQFKIFWLLRTLISSPWSLSTIRVALFEGLVLFLCTKLAIKALGMMFVGHWVLFIAVFAFNLNLVVHLNQVGLHRFYIGFRYTT